MGSNNDISLKALAKINLGLDVVRRREDGYHEVRMIMQTIHLYDRLDIKRTKEPGIQIQTNLSFLPVNENNLIYKAAKLLMRLVDFFRLSVKVDRSMVTLDDELELVEAYMELMCYRYPELFCDYDIDPDLGAVQVPNFILQPLVENSLLHGMKNRGYRGEIEISVKRAGADMEICIKDSGSGFEEGMKAQIDKMLLHYNKQEAKLDGNSIGILNVQKRIKYLCGRKYGLSYEENSAGGVTARLLLPVWKEEAS